MTLRDGNDALSAATLNGLASLADGGLLIANFIDFDTIHGHRRDVAGYAAALEAFDRRLPALLGRLGARRARGSIGRRHGFADIAATCAGHLGLPWTGSGTAFADGPRA